MKVKFTQLCLILCDPWTIWSMEFSRSEYWSGYLFPSSGDLPNPGIEPRSPALQEDSLPPEPQGKPKNIGVAYAFSSRSSQSRNRTRVSCIAGGFFCQLSYQGDNVVLNSAVQQSDSVTHTHMHTHTHVCMCFIFFPLQFIMGY